MYFMGYFYLRCTTDQFLCPHLPQGPYFAPPYEPLPDHVRFIYDGKTMDLSQGAEEAAGFFAKMLDHDYTTKDVFCKNFFQDWRKASVHVLLFFASAHGL